MEGSLRGRDVRKLNTQGCCFLCLKPNTIKLEVNGEVDDTEPELIRKPMSMRCLTRYLKLNLDGMEQVTSVATSKAGSKPEVDVEVDLCESCEKLASRFSSLFQQLEKVQMELEYYLGEIRHTVLHSSEAPELVQNYSKRMTRSSESLSLLETVDKLRSEIGEKALKTSRPPRVLLTRIERLSKQEVPDPVEDVDSADHFADFPKKASSSMENCDAAKSNNDCGQGLTPEVKAEYEDSPVISPKNDLKQSMKEKSHCSEDLYFSNSMFEESEVFQVKTENQEDAESVPVFEDAIRIKERNHLSKALCFSKNSGNGKEGNCGKCGVLTCVPPCEFRRTNSKLIKTQNIGIACEGEAEDFTENADDTNVSFPDFRASPTSSSKPIEDHQEGLKLGCRDNNETPSLMPQVKVKPRWSKYYTKNLSTGMYECKKCDETSKRPDNIADHFKSVHLKLTFKCDVCNISNFKGLSSLTKHKKRCRRNLEKELAKKESKFSFICDECGKRCETKKKLSSHLLNVHKNADRYPCDLCDKKFKKSEHLKKHRNALHLGKRFYCGFCSKSFAYKYDLQSHKRNLHKN